MHRFLIAALAAASLAGAAHAQFGGGAPPNADTDHDGKVTLAEFKAMQAHRLDRLFARLDKNKDGKISQAEAQAGFFMGAAARAAAQGSTAPRGGFLMRMDADHDGAVSRKEAEAQVERRFRAADTNNDGWLSRGELIMMRQGANGGPGQ